MVVREGVPYIVPRYDIVTTLSQDATVLTLPNGKTYTPGDGELMVFVDGIAHYPGIHYTELNSTQIQFSFTVEAGQRVRFRT